MIRTTIRMTAIAAISLFATINPAAAAVKVCGHIPFNYYFDGTYEGAVASAIKFCRENGGLVVERLNVTPLLDGAYHVMGSCICSNAPKVGGGAS